MLPFAALSLTTKAWLAPAILLLAALTVLLWPRAAAPSETPGLRLDNAEVAACLQAELERGSRRPKGATSQRVETLFRAHGAAEMGPGEPRIQADQRAQAMRETLMKLGDKDGAKAVAALRSALTDSALALVQSGTRDTQAAHELLGRLPEMLEQYGLSRSGRLVAPAFVVRTLLKARTNAILGLPLTDGFAPVERQAYFGWRALNGKEDPQTRLRALEEYAAAGGQDVDEAAGALHYLRGNFGQAAELYGAAYASSSSLRLHNHRLSATQRAAE